MRTVQYDRFPAIGPGVVPEEGSLLQFVLDIPYLFAFGLIPPLRVLNDLFGTGSDDHGMSGGCQWKPFTIALQEYEELVEALQADAAAHYREAEAPAWITRHSDWRTWSMAQELDIPYEEFSELSREDAKWEALKRQARAKGDEELAMEYHVKGLEAGKKLAEFIEPYIAKHHAKKRCPECSDS